MKKGKILKIDIRLKKKKSILPESLIVSEDGSSLSKTCQRQHQVTRWKARGEQVGGNMKLLRNTNL